jgi:hypothetical protein
MVFYSKYGEREDSKRSNAAKKSAGGPPDSEAK